MANATSTLTTYFKRGVIDGRQHQAGLLFLGDWKQRYPGVRSRWRVEPKVQRSDVTGFSMVGVAAARAGRALQVLGPLRHVVVAVVVEDQNAGEWMMSRGGKMGEGIVFLRFALDTLGNFYEIGRDDDAA